MIQNRIQKNYKRILPLLKKHQVEAFRLYDRDIPEFPFIVDIYKNYAVVYDRREANVDFREERKEYLNDILRSVSQECSISESNIIVKERRVQGRESQYEKMAQKNETLLIQEGPAKLIVNLYDYLDTGLFLDHRIMREKIFKESQGKRFLNLFCYTASVSVFAALGGATTTSVDMSNTYLEWAQDNFRINDINPQSHEFIQDNAIKFLEEHQPKQQYDLIFLDPPTFSKSKRMEGTFDVERDQVFLVQNSMRLLTPKGTLYFSNNKRDFRLEDSLLSQYHIKDISLATIPFDFHDKKIHHVFRVEKFNTAT